VIHLGSSASDLEALGGLRVHGSMHERRFHHLASRPMDRKRTEITIQGMIPNEDSD
jgi:hypothetical protein